MSAIICSAVYPRVGGGTPKAIVMPPTPTGLSPRGRGNQGDASGGDLVSGSIPAWAGEPCNGRRGRGQGRVYPRVGGGTV